MHKVTCWRSRLFPFWPISGTRALRFMPTHSPVPTSRWPLDPQAMQSVAVC